MKSKLDDLKKKAETKKPGFKAKNKPKKPAGKGKEASVQNMDTSSGGN